MQVGRSARRVPQHRRTKDVCVRLAAGDECASAILAPVGDRCAQPMERAAAEIARTVARSAADFEEGREAVLGAGTQSDVVPFDISVPHGTTAQRRDIGGERLGDTLARHGFTDWLRSRTFAAPSTALEQLALHHCSKVRLRTVQSKRRLARSIEQARRVAAVDLSILEVARRVVAVRARPFPETLREQFPSAIPQCAVSSLRRHARIDAEQRLDVLAIRRPRARRESQREREPATAQPLRSQPARGCNSGHQTTVQTSPRQSSTLAATCAPWTGSTNPAAPGTGPRSPS